MVEMNFSCPENVAGMALTENGRFCDSCQKDIVDYTGMSNDEVLDKLKRASGKTCGIFKKRQIIISNRLEIGSRFRLAFMLVFMFGMSSSKLMAQDTLTTFPPTFQITEVSDSTYTIKGIVVDIESNPIPFAKVWVDLDSIDGIQNRLYGKTDFDGIFRFTLPKETKTPISLSVQCIGYDTTIVQGIMFESGSNEVELVVTLDDNEMDLHIIGMIICPPPIEKDPYEIGKTRLDGEDIRQWD